MKSLRVRSRSASAVHPILRALLVAMMATGVACNTEEGGAGDASVADLNAEADLAGVDLTMGHESIGNRANREYQFPGDDFRQQ